MLPRVLRNANVLRFGRSGDEVYIYNPDTADAGILYGCRTNGEFTFAARLVLDVRIHVAYVEDLIWDSNFVDSASKYWNVHSGRLRSFKKMLHSLRSDPNSDQVLTSPVQSIFGKEWRFSLGLPARRLRRMIWREYKLDPSLRNKNINMGVFMLSCYSWWPGHGRPPLTRDAFDIFTQTP